RVNRKSACEVLLGMRADVVIAATEESLDARLKTLKRLNSRFYVMSVPQDVGLVEAMDAGGHLRAQRLMKISARAHYNAQGVSSILSYPLDLYGAAGRIRTHDPLVRSQVLYPTELQPLKEVEL